MTLRFKLITFLKYSREFAREKEWLVPVSTHFTKKLFCRGGVGQLKEQPLGSGYCCKYFYPMKLSGRLTNATYSQRHFDRNKNFTSEKTDVRTIYFACFPVDLTRNRSSSTTL